MFTLHNSFYNLSHNTSCRIMWPICCVLRCLMHFKKHLFSLLLYWKHLHILTSLSLSNWSSTFSYSTRLWMQLVFSPLILSLSMFHFRRLQCSTHVFSICFLTLGLMFCDVNKYRHFYSGQSYMWYSWMSLELLLSFFILLHK